MLVSRTKQLKLGDGLNKSVDVGPLINKDAAEKSDRYVRIGKQEGAKLLCGGSFYGKKGFFYQPTIFTDADSNMRIAQEEIFGPVLSLIPVKSLDEAIDVMNNIEYHIILINNIS